MGTILTQRQAVLVQLGLIDSALGIMMKKRKDYSGENDPFGNFRACEAFGVSAALGAVIRITDKINRIGNIIQADTVHEGGLVGESVIDTLRDVVNYACIIAGLLAEHDPSILETLQQNAETLNGTLQELYHE